jgi:hypothetical protein
MARDRSLDEFLGGGSDDAAETDAEDDDPTDPERGTEDDPTDPDPDVDEAGTAEPGAEPGSSGTERESEPNPVAGSDWSEGGDADGDPAATAAGDAEPAAVTYRWEPDGVPCAACGATVDRLWSGEAGQVCADCKEW